METLSLSEKINILINSDKSQKKTTEQSFSNRLKQSRAMIHLCILSDSENTDIQISIFLSFKKSGDGLEHLSD